MKQFKNALLLAAITTLLLASNATAAGPVRVLVLCTGNSARSQMAAGFLKSFDSKLDVYSAGTAPATHINPNAVKAMSEVRNRHFQGCAEECQPVRRGALRLRHHGVR